MLLVLSFIFICPVVLFNFDSIFRNPCFLHSFQEYLLGSKAESSLRMRETKRTGTFLGVCYGPVTLYNKAKRTGTKNRQKRKYDLHYTAP